MATNEGVPFDVLFVADPFRQWYGAGTVFGAPAPPEAWPRALGGADFLRRLHGVADSYRRVILLGDSMGATGALLFAEVATKVMAFCPQLDLESASIRPHYDAAMFARMQADILEGVRRCRGKVEIHTGTWQHDEAQARLAAHLPGVAVVVHDIDTHRVALALNQNSRLLPLIRNCILDEAQAV